MNGIVFECFFEDDTWIGGSSCKASLAYYFEVEYSIGYGEQHYGEYFVFPILEQHLEEMGCFLSGAYSFSLYLLCISADGEFECCGNGYGACLADAFNFQFNNFLDRHFSKALEVVVDSCEEFFGDGYCGAVLRAAVE